MNFRPRLPEIRWLSQALPHGIRSLLAGLRNCLTLTLGNLFTGAIVKIGLQYLKA
jgi:hypothetical protein